MKKVITALLSIVLSAFGLLAYMFVLAHRNRLMIHSASFGDSNKLTVFFISDIHRRRLSKKLVRKLRTLHIDAVIAGGDIAEKGVPLSRIQRNAELLASIGPLFYIFGNNDQEVGSRNVADIIDSAGGITLIDDTVPIPGHPDWGLCGLEDPSNGTVDIEKAADSAAWYKHTLLAVHNPSLFRKVDKYMKPEVMLAGHTHGGQIRFGKWGLQDLGSFERTDRRVKLISNGYGTTLVPLRLGAKPECHVVKIHY